MMEKEQIIERLSYLPVDSADLAARVSDLYVQAVTAGHTVLDGEAHIHTEGPREVTIWLVLEAQHESPSMNLPRAD